MKLILLFCRGTAFEKWWDDQRQRHEARAPTGSNTAPTTTTAAVATATTATTTTTTTPLLPGGAGANTAPTAAVEKKVAISLEGVGMGFGLGFGLRATLPKLPSFRVRPVIHSLLAFVFDVSTGSIFFPHCHLSCTPLNEGFLTFFDMFSFQSGYCCLVTTLCAFPAIVPFSFVSSLWMMVF